MKIALVADGVSLIRDFARPLGNSVRCEQIAQVGIQSLLVVDEDTNPYASMQGRLWCYVRPFADLAAPSPHEIQRIGDFVRYETSHGRRVGIWLGYRALEDVVVAAATAEAPSPSKRVSSDDACCCRPFHAGCSGTLVSHAAPIELAAAIFESGSLLSRPALTGRSLEEVAAEMHAWGQPDPVDYFAYVCLANGNCVAPDKVAMERHVGRWLTSQEAGEAFYPGVRFFFNPERLAQHPRVEWDGYNAIKVLRELELAKYLTAVVMPVVDREGRALEVDVPVALRDRVIRLDHREHPGLAAWSQAALAAVYQPGI